MGVNKKLLSDCTIRVIDSDELEELVTNELHLTLIEMLGVADRIHHAIIDNNIELYERYSGEVPGILTENIKRVTSHLCGEYDNSHIFPNDEEIPFTEEEIKQQELKEQAVHNITDDMEQQEHDNGYGCPKCGSYEGDYQECPECGHGQ